MEENSNILNKLEEKIKEWQEEIDTVWANADTDIDNAASERRNLQYLINNAKQKIENIKELEEKIKEWQEEIDTVWKDKNTDAAEVERRNLQNLINNAKQEIEKIAQNEAEEEKLIDPKEFLDEIKKTLENTKKEKEDELNYLDKELKKTDMTLEGLIEEQKMYESQKNQSYKEIYEEYGTKIEEYKKKKDEMIKEKEEVRKQLDELDIKSILDDKLQAVQILTRGRMDLEKRIRNNGIKLRKLTTEVSEILNSEELTPEELQKKTAKLYKDIDKLKKQIQDDEVLMNEFQQYINIIEGREDIQNSSDFSNEQKSEIMKFFHGQGDTHENVQRDENGEIEGNVNRDDRRGNDEYFGFEGHDGSGKNNPENDDKDKDDDGINKGHDDDDDDKGKDHDDDDHKTDGYPFDPDPGPGPNPEPPGPGPGPGPDPEPPGPDPDPTKKLPVKSGLQIFREQFNQMDEIKRRHTASERAPFYQTALAVGGIAALTAANLPLAVSMFVAAPVLKPALKLVTGQSALEKNIADQFRNLKNTNPEEFDRMVDYLSEEKIQDLKPNAVILNALHKVSKERTAELIKDFKEETDSLERARKELLSKKTDELTDQDRHALEHINERLIEINEGSRYIDDDGNERFKEGLAQMAQRRYKELKRGKDRVSQRYKGNLLTRFNIFAHRNSDSKTYKGPLNELANAELARDKGILSGNDIDAATEQQRMDEIMSKNTHTNFLGVQNSVFNDRRAGKTGPIRLISDMLDNTYKNVLTIAAMAGTILTAKGIVSKAKVNNIGNKDLAQKAANAEQSNTYATAETAAIRKEGVGGSAKYLEMDAKANQIGDQAGTTINENSLSGQLRQLGDQISKGMEARKMLQSASQGRVGYKGYVADHSNQIALQTDLVKNEEARGKILKTAADLIDKVEQNGNEIVKKAFIGPIAAGIGALHRVASGIVNNYKEHKDKSEASGR